MYARLLVAAATVAALAGCEVNLNSEGIGSRGTKQFAVSARPEVELETFDGSIEIHSWDRNEVEIEIEKRAMEQSLVDDITIAAEQQGNKVILKVTGPSRDEHKGI